MAFGGTDNKATECRSSLNDSVEALNTSLKQSDNVSYGTVTGVHVPALHV